MGKTTQISIIELDFKNSYGSNDELATTSCFWFHASIWGKSIHSDNTNSLTIKGKCALMCRSLIDIKKRKVIISSDFESNTKDELLRKINIWANEVYKNFIEKLTSELDFK